MGELVPGPPAQLLDPAATYERERHPMLTYLARPRPSGRRTQAAALDTLAGALSGGRLGSLELPWHLFRYPHTAALRSWLAETYQVGTARTYLSALRGVLREWWRLELLSTDAYERARDLEAMRGEVLPRGCSLSGGELRALFEALAIDERPIARRNACALVLLVGAGVRRAELAGLQLDQVDTESARVEVRQGKGRKDRVCWLPPSALPALRDWLAVRGSAPGPLLVPVRKGGRIEDRALSAQAVRDLCRELARLAATEPFTPHDLRRTWTGDLLDASGDLAIVQQLAGHASPATTSRYDRRPEATRRRAAELLHVPYVAPHPVPGPPPEGGPGPRRPRRRIAPRFVRGYDRRSRYERGARPLIPWACPRGDGDAKGGPGP
jgi:integrase